MEKILIVDDEPHYLEWLKDFLIQKNYEVIFATTTNEAYGLLSESRYRAVVVDLNIPVAQDLKQQVDSKGPIYSTFPGLFIADYARNRGHRTRQVIVYSVHIVDAVAEECKKLYCTYLSKGRPRTFKGEILEVLSYDPTETPEKSTKTRRLRATKR